MARPVATCGSAYEKMTKHYVLTTYIFTHDPTSMTSNFWRIFILHHYQELWTSQTTLDMDQRQEWEESLSNFFYHFETLLQSQFIKCHCSHVVCDFSFLGKDKKWNRFKVLKIQLRISFSFGGIEIGRSRLQFCKDIHFYRIENWKLKLGWKGQWTLFRWRTE